MYNDSVGNHPDSATAGAYSTLVNEHAAAYESVEPDPLLPHFVLPGSSILDIGCGTGRDLAHLHRLGIRVTGVEPSEKLLEKARLHHTEIAHRLFRGFLPNNIPAEIFESAPEGFDTLLLSAVLMHIPDSVLFDSAVTIRSLLKPKGNLIISVPIERADVNPLTQRSTDGRLMILRPVSRIRLLFERLGMELINRWESVDRLKRKDIRWVTLQFRGGTSGLSRPVEMIERVINRDTKTATYKLALLRACCDIAQQEGGRVYWRPDGRIAVGVDDIAEKWIEYYWPLITAPRFLAQKHGENQDYPNQLAFRTALSNFASEFTGLGGLAAYITERNSNRLPREIAETRRLLTAQICTAIVKGPVYYSGGGSSEDKPFAYDKTSGAVLVSADLWREFALLGHWIRDSLLLRWAEESRRMTKNTWSVEKVLALLLSRPDPERHVSEARKLYLSRLPDVECTWTGKTIRKRSELHVDHAIPYVLWKDNSLWNLLPVSQKANNNKRDKLPTLNLLKDRQDIIIDYWRLTRDSCPERFANEAAVMARNSDHSNWEIPLFSAFTEAIETTALRRGIERWDGL